MRPLIVLLKGGTSLYQVLYRKWRSKTFDEVYGQPHVTAALKNELKTGRLAHAYLFTGSRGTGQNLLCEDSGQGSQLPASRGRRTLQRMRDLPRNRFRGRHRCCGDRRRIQQRRGQYPGFGGKRCATPLPLRNTASISWTRCICSQPGLSTPLLKTLEEPPSHVIFILATTEVHKLPATILSRCQRFDFIRIAPTDIAARLRFVAEQEGFTVTEDALLLLARLADGRDAGRSVLARSMRRSDKGDHSSGGGRGCRNGRTGRSV